MTDLYAFDAAYKPNLAAVKAAGGIAINHYLTGIYARTSTQPADALAAGLGSILTYEEGPSELVGASRAVGQGVGRKILAAVQALKIVPLDNTVAVYPSVDVNAPAASCEQSFLGIRDVLDGGLLLHDYAEGAIIDDLAAHHITQGKGWLAAPTSWPGFNPGSPNVVMVQLVGTNVPGTDRNHLILTPQALGALWPAGSPYANGDIDMTPEQEAKLDKLIDLVSQSLTLDKRIDFGLDNGGPTPFSERGEIIDRLRSDVAANAGIAGQVAGLLTAVQQLAGGSVDLAAVTAAAKAGAQSALDGATATVKLNPGATA